MKKILFIICLSIASCKNKNPQDKLKEKCFPVVKKYIESIVGKTDSLIITSVDTLTHAGIEVIKTTAYDSEYRKIKRVFDHEMVIRRGHTNRG